MTQGVDREASPADAFPPGQDTLHVVVIDDHLLLAEALALALAGQGITCEMPPLDHPAALVPDIVARRPDLVLLDLDLGGFGDGGRLVRPLTESSVRVLIVSAAAAAEPLAQAVEDGAVGVVAKDGPFCGLVRTVVAAAHGQEVMTPVERLRLLDAAQQERHDRDARVAPLLALSPREEAVLRALAEGRSVAGIARASVVAEATVRSQVRSILTKLGVTSQLEAVAMAHRAGWC